MTVVPCATPFRVIPAEAGIQQKSEPGFVGLKDEHDEQKGCRIKVILESSKSRFRQPIHGRDARATLRATLPIAG